MDHIPLEEQPQVSASPSTPESQPTKPSTAIRNIISLSAAILAASFFMPWASLFRSNISGLGIQQHFQSYSLVWLLPASALFTLTLNTVGVPTGLVRRIVGLLPFAILAYSLNRFGSRLFDILSWGGWLALPPVLFS